MSEKAVEQKTMLELYGSKDHLEHLAGRIKLCVPGGRDLSNVEALALAQLSLSTKFNAAIGEIWYVPGKGPMVGIRGYRNRAKGQSTYSLEFRNMTPDEIHEHQVRTEVGDIGRICELYHHKALQNAVAINMAMKSNVVPIRPILGVGIWRKAWPEGGQKKNDPIPHGKSPMWVADKRAEADALNKGFDITVLPYGDEVEFQVAMANGYDDVIETEAIYREAAANAERVVRAEEDKTAKEHTDDLFGEEKPVVADSVEETLPEPIVGPEEVVEEEKPMAGADPLQDLRQLANAQKEKNIAPSGAQLKLLGALCAVLGEHGLPYKSLFTLKDLAWPDENFLRAHFKAILQYVFVTDSKGNLENDESGQAIVKEGIVEVLTPLLGAEIPSDEEFDLPF